MQDQSVVSVSRYLLCFPGCGDVFLSSGCLKWSRPLILQQHPSNYIEWNVLQYSESCVAIVVRIGQIFFFPPICPYLGTPCDTILLRWGGIFIKKSTHVQHRNSKKKKKLNIAVLNDFESMFRLGGGSSYSCWPSCPRWQPLMCGVTNWSPSRYHFRNSSSVYLNQEN